MSDWYTDNRKRFEAETTVFQDDGQRCNHRKALRKDIYSIECPCGAGWRDSKEHIDSLAKHLNIVST